MRIVRIAAVLAALLPAPPAASATPTADPTPQPTAGAPTSLREIGRVHATTPLCRALVTDAVEAVAIETENDRRLTDAAVALRTLDFDSSQLAKRRATDEIGRRYVELRAAAVTGNGLMKQFRTAAKTAETPEARERFIVFANALDGALHRQKSLANDLGKLIGYLDAHEPIDQFQHEQDEIEAHKQLYRDAARYGPDGNVPLRLGDVTVQAAKLIEDETPSIAADEAAASDRIDPAFTGC